MNDGALTMLGFARKAGKLSPGFCAAAEAVKKNMSRLVIVACDISPKSEKEIKYLARDKIPVIRTRYSTAELSAATGTRAGIFSVNDDQFTDSILKRITSGGTANDD